MIPFSIITLGDFVSPTGLQTAIRSFSNFYHNITAKHQRRLTFYIIDNHENVDEIARLCINEGIEKATCILHLGEQDDIVKIYKSASVFLLPIQENKDSIVQESLSYGLPILSFLDAGYEEYIDQTCGMLLKPTRQEEHILEFARMLQLLYFDPEAREFLKRGATNKYKAHFSWGLDSRERARRR